MGKQSDVMTTDHEVKIANSKDVDSTTGIFMDYMPYILVVVIAGVFGVFFLCGRKHEIDEIWFESFCLINKRRKADTCEKSMVYCNPQNYGFENLSALINYIESKSIQYKEMEFSSGEQIIGMSTCKDAVSNARVLLFGKMIPENWE